MAIPRFFDFTRPGKGAKSDENCPAFILFFRRYGRHFSKLLFANLICAIVCLPVYVWLTGIINLIVIEETGGVISVLSSVLMAIVVDWPQWILILLVVASALLCGPVNAALSHCARNCAWDIPGMFWSEFFEAFKENLKQSMMIGIFDIVLIFSSIYYLIDGRTAFGAFFPVLLIVWIIFALFYSFAHAYFFPVMVSVDLSFFDLIKNCFILALVKIWRPLAVLAITAALLFCCLWADMLIIPCFFFSVIAYASSFLGRPVIEKYLIYPENEDGKAE